ncbi:MAG: hypothetical protein GY820_24240 [Gammaproteobacteria bacterium]|nr:hypothetical protein [Gammaproteobacteria bacterium]
MHQETDMLLFKMLTLSFILSMLFFIFRRDLVTTLVGYDLLGLTSFLLIMYYKRQSVLSSATITLMLNKIGDLFLIICLLGSLSTGVVLHSSTLRAVCLLVAGLVKTAQLPFSSWLPLAIAAPTPIRALVHSSTLVTAGIYLLMKYPESFSHPLLFCFSSATCLVASLSGMLETDFKKVVAFSTMSQIRMILFTMSLGLNTLAFFHLITHALFKRLIFLAVGTLLHESLSCQHHGLILRHRTLSTCLLSVSLFGLIGLMFRRGFLSKDVILASVESRRSRVLMGV